MLELRARALRLLARRDHSRVELAQKLTGYAESESALTTLLDALESERLLSDRRYASARVAQRATRLGNARLKQELLAQGVDDEAVCQALAESGDEIARCRTVWNKKFGALPDNPAERARQMRFLQYRGFSPDAIRQVLRGSES